MEPPDKRLAAGSRWRVITFWLVSAIPVSGLFSGCASPPDLEPAGALTAPSPPSDSAEQGVPLFDGQTMTGWADADFAGKGEIRVQDGELILGTGYMTGVTYTNAVPRMNYEIRLEAKRVDGNDFFCGLTFPVGESVCSFIVGGWGGGVVGLSSIDGEDAAHNETTQYLSFESGRWYGIRIRVTPEKIEAWIDEDQVVDQEIGGRKVSIRIEMEPCVPMGLATYSTTGAYRNIRLRTF